MKTFEIHQKIVYSAMRRDLKKDLSFKAGIMNFGGDG
jgi:hypothetical protein